MSALNDFISGRGELPSPRKLSRLAEQFPWCTTVRRVRALVTREPDPMLTLPLAFWPTVAPVPRPTDLIDRFIEHGGYRITPDDAEREVEVEVEIDPEMVSPQLAEIYRSQGLTEKADEIYRLLRLRDS